MTKESIDLPARLEEMAKLLILQRADPLLMAFDSVDLKLSAAHIRRLEAEVARLTAENVRLAASLVSAIGQEIQPEEYETRGDEDEDNEDVSGELCGLCSRRNCQNCPCR